jgi:hypothetical protein
LAIDVTLYDANGVVIYSGELIPGQVLKVDLLLAAGSYTIRFAGGTADGSPLNLDYQVKATTLGDPIGPPLVNPDQPPPPRDTEPTWLANGLLKILALLDPFGHPYGTSSGNSPVG